MKVQYSHVGEPWLMTDSGILMTNYSLKPDFHRSSRNVGIPTFPDAACIFTICKLSRLHGMTFVWFNINSHEKVNCAQTGCVSLSLKTVIVGKY